MLLDWSPSGCQVTEGLYHCVQGREGGSQLLLPPRRLPNAPHRGVYRPDPDAGSHRRWRKTHSSAGHTQRQVNSNKFAKILVLWYRPVFMIKTGVNLNKLDFSLLEKILKLTYVLIIKFYKLISLNLNFSARASLLTPRSEVRHLTLLAWEWSWRRAPCSPRRTPPSPPSRRRSPPPLLPPETAGQGSLSG